jgi:hypothetical protein
MGKADEIAMFVGYDSMNALLAMLRHYAIDPKRDIPGILLDDAANVIDCFVTEVERLTGKNDNLRWEMRRLTDKIDDLKEEMRNHQES